MHKVIVLLADGFEEIEALTPVDVLRRAGCIVSLVSIGKQLEVSSSRGVRVLADQLFEDADFASASMIVLPGGQPGANNLDAHQGLRSSILEFDAQGKWLAAICAAPLVLGNLGLLNGRKATCYPGIEPYLAGAFYTAHAVEIDGKIITGNGPGAAIAFSFELVTQLLGPEKAFEIRHKMLVN